MRGAALSGIAAPDQSRIILTHTNDEVRELNEAARDRMHAAGQLGDDVRVKTERGARAFATGDRIMFLRNERGLEVKNGTLGTVEKVSPEHVAVHTDDGRSVSFDTKDYAHVDHGYAATIHKAQGMTVDRAHMLATPGMDRHGAYVGMSRHRDGMALHYGRDDFKDQSRLVGVLSRERAKDMASDYARADPAKEFAERRGIGLGERIAEIVRPVAEKARGIFDGLRLSLAGQDRGAAPTPEPRRGIFDGLDLSGTMPKADRDPARQQQRDHDPQPMRAGGLRGAVERYARALDAIHQTRAQGIDAMPHQREAFDRAREALDAIRPNASADLGAAFQRQPALVHEAAEGRGQVALRAMSQEAELRADPYSRADRFVEGWQQLRQAQDELRRDGDFRGAKRVGQDMAGMAKSLERDAQVESLLSGRRQELGIDVDMGRSLASDLADSVPFDHGRDLGMSR